jgi:hypothetical protein
MPLGRLCASLERSTPPRVILRLARGPNAPSGDSPPRSRPPRTHGAAPTPPTRALNALARRGRPGQKANPLHAGPLTPPGNHIPALFRQPALCGHPWHCAGKASVNSVTLCHPLPYDPHVVPLEGGRQNTLKRYRRLPRARIGQRRDIRPVERVSSVTSALCGPPRRCAAIPGTAAPSLALCGSLERQDIATTAAVRPPALHQLHPRVSVRMATKQGILTQPPSKPLLDGYRARHDARREQDSSGRPSTPRHCAPRRHM